MNSYNPAVNTIRQYFRNVFSSGIFLAFTIAATVYTAFTTGEFLLSMLNAGIYTEGFDIVNLVFPVLSIIGTVGLYCLRSASKSGDGERVLSSLNMSRCLSAMIIIVNVAGYIISSVVIILSILIISVRGFLEEMLTNDEFLEFIEDFEGLDELLGNMSVIFAVAFLFIGLILLAVCILANIYRRGITKTIRAAKNAETNTYAPFKISTFTIIFGYILGVIVALNSFSFITFDDPLVVLQGILGSLASLSLGVTLFMLSLVLSRLKSQLSMVVYTPAYEKHCPSCGASVPYNSPFCTQCGSSTNVQTPVYNTAAPAYTAPVQPSPAPQQQNDVAEEKAPDDDRQHAFCTNCGKPVDPAQTFCPNCGFKLK